MEFVVVIEILFLKRIIKKKNCRKKTHNFTFAETTNINILFFIQDISKMEKVPERRWCLFFEFRKGYTLVNTENPKSMFGKLFY